MNTEDKRFIVIATLSAFILLNSLGNTPARWFQQASFFLSYGVLVYIIYIIFSDLVSAFRS